MFILRFEQERSDAGVTTHEKQEPHTKFWSKICAIGINAMKVLSIDVRMSVGFSWLRLGTNSCFFWVQLNPLNADLNPTFHLLALLGGATIVVVSRLRVNTSISIEMMSLLSYCATIRWNERWEFQGEAFRTGVCRVIINNVVAHCWRLRMPEKFRIGSHISECGSLPYDSEYFKKKKENST
jgi:hypothetical protein